MASKLAVFAGLTPISTGNADFTSSDMGGNTPKAAIIIVTKVADGDNVKDNAAICIGVTDGTTHNSFHYHDVDNVSTTLTYAGCETDLIKIKNDNGSGFDIEASFVSFINNGIRLNFSNIDSDQYYMQIYLFGDEGSSECSVKVGNFNIPTNSTPVDINTVGFEPDLVLFFSTADAVGSSGTFAQIISGVCANITDTPQGGMHHFSNHNQSTTDIQLRMNSNYVQERTVSTDWQVGASSFDSDGFTITMNGSNSASGLNCTYLALKFTDRNVWCGQYDLPTSTGNDSKTGIGFKPEVVGVFQSTAESIDANETGLYAEGAGYGAFTDSYIASLQVMADDAVGTSNTQSGYDGSNLTQRVGGGATSWVASFVSMDDDGFTLNFTSAPGTTRYVYTWAISEALEGKSRIAVFETTTPSTTEGTGTKDFTSSDLKGNVPKAAIIMCVPLGIGDSSTSHARLSYGFTDGVNHFSVGWGDEDALATTDSRSAQTNNLIYIFSTSMTSTYCVAEFDSFITNGIRLNFTDVTTTNYRMIVILFGDDGNDECQAYVNKYTIPSDSTPLDINTVGFEPDLLLLLGSVDDWVGTSTSAAQLILGVCANIAGTPQGFTSHSSRGGVSTTEMRLRPDNTYAYGRSYPSGDTLYTTISDFDSSGFTVTMEGNNHSPGEEAAYLALKFTDRDVWCGDYSTPNSTGNDEFSDIGFTSEVIGGYLTGAASINFTQGGSGSEGSGPAVMTSDLLRVYNIIGEDNTTTSDTRIVAHEDFEIDRHSQSPFEASFVSMDDDGFTLNYSAVSGTYSYYSILWAVSELIELTAAPKYRYFRNRRS